MPKRIAGNPELAENEIETTDILLVQHDLSGDNSDKKIGFGTLFSWIRGKIVTSIGTAEDSLRTALNNWLNESTEQSLSSSSTMPVSSKAVSDALKGYRLTYKTYTEGTRFIKIEKAVEQDSIKILLRNNELIDITISKDDSDLKYYALRQNGGYKKLNNIYFDSNYLYLKIGSYSQVYIYSAAGVDYKCTSLTSLDTSTLTDVPIQQLALKSDLESLVNASKIVNEGAKSVTLLNDHAYLLIGNIHPLYSQSNGMCLITTYQNIIYKKIDIIGDLASKLSSKDLILTVDTGYSSFAYKVLDLGYRYT